MSNEVILFSSSDTGAPQLTGQAGSLIALLDALLVNGYNLKTALSVTVASGVATASISAHGYQSGRWVKVAGATPAGLNGRKQITVVDSNTVTFDATGIPDGAASGTITVKRAPLDWQKAFTNTNLAAYRSLDSGATGHYVRVDDSAAQYARLIAYEAMTDVNTGTGQFPTTAQLSGGVYWHRSSAADSTTRQWLAVGTTKCLYLAVSPGTGGQFYVHGFGDMVPYRPGDPYRFVLAGAATSDSTGISNGCLGYSDRTYNGGGNVFASRSYSGLGSSQKFYRWGTGHTGPYQAGDYSGGQGYGVGSYPNPCDGGLMLSRLRLVQSNLAIRFEAPGLVHIAHDARGAFAIGDMIPASGDLAGRNLVAIPLGASGTSISGQLLIDTTGPWE